MSVSLFPFSLSFLSLIHTQTLSLFLSFSRTCSLTHCLSSPLSSLPIYLSFFLSHSPFSLALIFFLFYSVLSNRWCNKDEHFSGLKGDQKKSEKFCHKELTSFPSESVFHYSARRKIKVLILVSLTRLRVISKFSIVVFKRSRLKNFIWFRNIPIR